MKKVVIVLCMIVSSLLCVSCTDNSLEEIEQRNETELQSTDPGDDGKIITEDPDDDGEG
ncbi:hypothetical protein [uncultured Tenacibaculum sp.]|uniref:hypothetical protein n=1 Tax=uncultured Tenacibaculum sp. TaxID=174713 RepID=UPI00262430BF|nr:hypothetical protein [uncultured Tenacibaculum sp.]